MSSEDRLARLGLLHLRHDPEALQEALRKIIAVHEREVEAWHALLQEKRDADDVPDRGG